MTAKLHSVAIPACAAGAATVSAGHPPAAARQGQAVAERVRIDATKLTEAALSDDGRQLRLRLVDQAGQAVSLSLPAHCLGAVIAALPQRIEASAVHALDAWSMRAADNGDDFLLTLRTSEGAAVSFKTKAWQVEGMATIAAHGRPQRRSVKRLH